MAPHDPPMHSAEEGGQGPRFGMKSLSYYLIDLQILTPLLLVAFAIASLAFIIDDAVGERYAVKTRSMMGSLFDVAHASIDIGETCAITPATCRADASHVVQRLQSDSILSSSGSSYAPLLRAAANAIRSNATDAALQSLYALQLALLDSISSRIDPLHVGGTLMYSLLRQVHLSQERAGGLLQMAEGTPSAARGMEAAATNVLCAPHLQYYVASQFPACASVVSCDYLAQQRTLSASGVVVSLRSAAYGNALGELHNINHVVRDLLDKVRDDFIQSSLSRSNFTKRMAILCAAFFVSFVGAIFSVMLVLSQYRSLHEQSVVESDFDCNAHRVKIQPATLRAVDEISSRIGVMGTLYQPADDEPKSGHQIELHLRRAVEPLAMLRPFVPNFMYVRHLRGSMMARSTSALLRNSEMLNLETGLRKKVVAFLFVGLRRFNRPNAELSDLNELLGAVHIACSHFQGNVVQMSSEGLVATFTRATINEDESGEALQDGEVLATHAAMAIDAMCSSPLVKPDGTTRPPFGVSMVIVQSISFAGVLSYHVSKSFTLLGKGISHAVAVESLNDVHQTSILATSATNDLISDAFITRPVHYVPGVGSVFHVIGAIPDEEDPNREAIAREQHKVREKTANWKKVWEKYEALVSTDKPTYETLEEAYRDLEAYKVFQMDANEHDTAYQLALAHVKRVAQNLGVNLGSTVEEE